MALKPNYIAQTCTKGILYFFSVHVFLIPSEFPVWKQLEGLFWHKFIAQELTAKPIPNAYKKRQDE